MPDFAQFFEQALAENGVEANVSQSEDPTLDQFFISKPIGEQKLTYTTTINMRINTNPDEIRKQIAAEAREVAQQFEEYLTVTFEWDDRRVTVSAMENGWAKCELCGTEVEVPNKEMPMFTEDAELSTPQPLPRDRESAIRSLDEGSRLLLRMYLIGRLRANCDPACRNSKHYDESIATERFI